MGKLKYSTLGHQTSMYQYCKWYMTRVVRKLPISRLKNRVILVYWKLPQLVEMLKNACMFGVKITRNSLGNQKISAYKDAHKIIVHKDEWTSLFNPKEVDFLTTQVIIRWSANVNLTQLDQNDLPRILLNTTQLTCWWIASKSWTETKRIYWSKNTTNIDLTRGYQKGIDWLLLKGNSDQPSKHCCNTKKKPSIKNYNIQKYNRNWSYNRVGW